MSTSPGEDFTIGGVGPGKGGSAVPVLWGYRDFWGNLAWRKRIRSAVWSHLDRNAFLRRRRRGLRHVDLEEISRSSRTTVGELPLLVVVRNEGERLIPFLRHYRRLGVTSFFVVDDQSTDGTVEFLLSEPDVRVFSSNVRFADAQMGEYWRQLLAERIGLNRWFVNVDADEYLVYDGMDEHPLPEFVSFLEKRKVTRVLAPMVDMFSERGVAGVQFDPAREPWEIVDRFDTANHKATCTTFGIVVNGGARTRLFGTVGNRTKFPLLYWDRHTVIARSIHMPLPYWRNFGVPYGALLHLKLFADFARRSAEAVEDGQHFDDARSYRRYLQVLSSGRELEFDGGEAVRYTGPRDLIRHGFMAPIPWSGRWNEFSGS